MLTCSFPSFLLCSGNNGKECNDLFTYDVTRNQWTKTPAPGMLSAASSHFPAARYGHASCVYGNGMLLIVGGCKTNNTYFKDAYSMNLETRQWRKLEDLPLDLAYHALFTWNNQAFLFGGYNGKSYVKHIYALDGMTGKWTPMHCTGTEPPPMCGAATVLRGNDFFVFGGYTEQGHTNELYRLNMFTRVWTLLPTTNKPLARAYLQAAVVNDVCFIFGGYDGKGCISDFRSILLPDSQSGAPPIPGRPSLSGGSAAAAAATGSSDSTPPRFGDPTFWRASVEMQVHDVLRYYARGSDAVNRQQLHSLIGELGNAFRQVHLSRPLSNGTSGVSSGGGGSYPFDTTNLDQLVMLGFDKELVLRVMTRMHSVGQSTRDVNLVVDMCCREDQPPSQSPGELDRQNSEREALKSKMQALVAEQEESKMCKVCYAEQINCALLDCGHLAVCISCAEGLTARKSTCPICQRPIRGKLKVFWT
jgi:N-acetylneuraminic acid mutarotase